jgi:hypothetical protein
MNFWKKLLAHPEGTRSAQPQEKGRTIHWLDPEHLRINGIPLFVTIDPKKYGNQRAQYDKEQGLALLKTQRMIEQERDIRLPAKPKIFEMGIFKGGSVVLYDQMFDPERLVAVEMDRNRLPGLDAYISENNRDRVVKTYYGVDQSSLEKMTKILSSQFPDRNIDLVIDDASHFFEQTRDALNIVFPYMSPGSVYVIEDWGWAHWGKGVWKNPYFENKTPLTNLIFKLVALSAADPGIVESVETTGSIAVVRRGPKRVHDGWDIDSASTWREGVLKTIE